MKIEDEKIVKKRRFQSFENIKEGKFAAYQYGKNILIGKGIQEDDNEYQQLAQNGQQLSQFNKNASNQKRNKNIIKNTQQNSSSQVQNLWQIWEKLGKQQQQQTGNLDQQTDKGNVVLIINQESRAQCDKQNQLTEQELMAIFGDGVDGQGIRKEKQSMISSNRCIENNIDNNSKWIVNVKDNDNDMGKNDQETVDKELMDIWGQDIQEGDLSIKQQVKNTQAIKSIKIDNNLHHQQQNYQQEQYDWEQTNNLQQQSKKQQQQDKIRQQNLFDSDDDLDEKMQLEDPNFITFPLNDQPQLKQKQQSKGVLENKKGQTIKQNQQDQPNQHLHQQQQLSIINQIIIQNSHKKEMNKLIPKTHYHIYDTKKFTLNPFKPNTYSYFGIQTKAHSLLSNRNCNIKNIPSIDDEKENVFYLYCFQTQQLLLELKPDKFQSSYSQFLSVNKTVTVSPGRKTTQRVLEYSTDLCYKIRVCSTQQHIATLFYKIIKGGYLYDLRLFDEYEQIHSEPIALIQVKDGFVNGFCYCDTNVFIEKVYQNDPQLAFSHDRMKFQIEKLRMILNLKNGRLTANMGIGGVESSPFNCCLENNESEKFIYLVGLLQDNVIKEEISSKDIPNKKEDISLHKQDTNGKKKKSFIIKVGQGLSPLLGLVIAAGRKIYIDSFQ